MPVGLLIITHAHVGRELLETAVQMLGLCPLRTGRLDVPMDADTDALRARARSLCAELDAGDGVLVLTDLYGSTPCNIALELMDKARVQVVAGVNLPMLVRVLNYPTLDLWALTTKAVTGGHDGIVICEEVARG
ncbi:MAG TPA: PTS sugar transporter subunit IIA [Chromatiales bacterium]|nr:PTS sugar transporter subunit IIA [Chromatiales bacterium]